MTDFRETAFNYIVGDKKGIFFSSEAKWVNKIKRLEKDYPDDVHIVRENDDGSIVANIPVKYFKISAPRKMSEEQRRKASERFKKMWAEKNN